MIDFDNAHEAKNGSSVKIKVLGVGGAGGNTVNSMIESELASYIEFVVANTDCQALSHSKADVKIQLGSKATKGLGSGANPELGRRAMEEDLDKVLQSVEQADIVFIAAGMGGGTGSGGAPVIAKALKERGILTIAVVTKPFSFEGKRRMDVAESSLDQLKKEVDTLIVVPNQKLLDIVDRNVSMIDAFAMINEILIHSVKSIADIIAQPGHINVDFADLRAIMKGMGLAMMGTGSAEGEDRAKQAAQQAISSSLLEDMDIKSARGILLNITGGPDLSLHEINDAVSVIYDESDKKAHVILGSVIDPNMSNKVVVSVIATGFNIQEKVSPYAQAEAKPKVAAPTLDGSLLQRVSDPMLERVQTESEKAEEKRGMMQSEVAKSDEHDDSLEIPTFLRKPESNIEFSDNDSE
jgi:cell division protein FtsZ